MAALRTESRRHRRGARVGARRAGAAGAGHRRGQGRRRRPGARRRSRDGAAAAPLAVRRAARARSGVRAAHLPRDPGRLGAPAAGCAADPRADAAAGTARGASRAPKAPTATRPRCSTSASRSGRWRSRPTDRSRRCSKPCIEGHVDRAMLPIENTTAGSVYEVVRPAAAVQSVARRRGDRRRAALPARRGRRAARVAAPHPLASAGAVAVQRVPRRRCRDCEGVSAANTALAAKHVRDLERPGTRRRLPARRPARTSA